ncbi:hypothetical protein HDV04_001158 [Boothiomyces sp. JEL0838]|nr:hypothetical protein HDV04_001158 [Boothiomyces sp. JEL0838]
MYIRVKHQKTIIFVNTKPTDSIYKFKQSIVQMLQKQKETKQIRLLLSTKDGYSVCENNSTIDQLGLVNDSVLYMVYLDESQDGGFEAVNVPPFEPLYDE